VRVHSVILDTKKSQSQLIELSPLNTFNFPQSASCPGNSRFLPFLPLCRHQLLPRLPDDTRIRRFLSLHSTVRILFLEITQLHHDTGPTWNSLFHGRRVSSSKTQYLLAL